MKKTAILFLVILSVLYNPECTYAEITEPFDCWHDLVFYQADQKLGWTDRLDSYIQPAIYDAIVPLDENRFIVRLDNQYGIAERNGDIVIQPEWSEIRLSQNYINDQIVFLYSENQTEVFSLEKKKTVTVLPSYERIRGFVNGYALIRHPDQLWEIIDGDGNNILWLYGIQVWLFENSVCIINDHKGYYLSDLHGKALTAHMNYIGLMQDGKAICTNGQEEGWIDERGSLHVFPLSLEIADDFIYKDRVLIRQQGKYGFVNLEGQIVIPPVWDDALPFSDDLSLVEKDGKYGFIDLSGNVVSPPEYDQAASFHRGITTAEKEGDSFVLDRQGNHLLSQNHHFDQIGESGLNNELLLAHMPEDDQTYYITCDGSIVCPFREWRSEQYDAEDD